MSFLTLVNTIVSIDQGFSIGCIYNAQNAPERLVPCFHPLPYPSYLK